MPLTSYEHCSVPSSVSSSDIPKVSRSTPTLTEAVALSNTASGFFKPTGALLVYQSYFFDLKTHAALTQVCRRATPFFQSPLTNEIHARLQHLLEAAVQGDKNEVEKLILKTPYLLYMRGSVKDPSGRVHRDRTVLQIAYGAGDRLLRTTDEEAMVEMIERLLRKRKHGSAEIAKQFSEQFPEGIEELSKKQVRRDSNALHKLINVVIPASQSECKNARIIMDDIRYYLFVNEQSRAYTKELHPLIKKLVENVYVARSKPDFEEAFKNLIVFLKQKYMIASDNFELGLVKAIFQFRNYLELKGAYTTGKHFNHILLWEAVTHFKINFTNFGNNADSEKNALYFESIIGYIQRFLPACDAQLVAQGLQPIFANEKIKRSMRFSLIEENYFPLDSNPQTVLGYNMGINERGGSFKVDNLRSFTQLFSELCNSRTFNVIEPLQESCCTIL